MVRSRIVASCRRLAAPLMLATACAGGCAAPPKTPEPVRGLRVTRHVGGTHYRTLVHDGTWYQTLGPRLLVVDDADGSVRTTVRLAEPGRTGPATDLAVLRGRLFVVLRDDAVVECALDDPAVPVPIGLRSAGELGIAPRRLGVAGGELYVSGPGGVVRWFDGARMMERSDDVGPVVMGKFGPLVTIGRRIQRLSDDAYAGSASELVPLAGDDAPPGPYVFLRRGDGAASVGLMTADLREVNVEAATIRIDGDARAVRVFGDRLWVITASSILGYEIGTGELSGARRIELGGVTDVAALDANRLAVAGVFGRAVVALGPNDGSATVLHIRAVPAGLSWARFDGRTVVAGGPFGGWRYGVDGSLAALDVEDAVTTAQPATTAVSIAGSARIAGDGHRLVLKTQAGERTYAEPDGGPLACVVSVEGRFWIGHDRGITVLDGGGSVVGSLRLDGPVRFIFPLFGGGGAIFVSEMGGIGAAIDAEPAP